MASDRDAKTRYNKLQTYGVQVQRRKLELKSVKRAQKLVAWCVDRRRHCCAGWRRSAPKVH